MEGGNRESDSHILLKSGRVPLSATSSGLNRRHVIKHSVTGACCDV